MFSSFEEEETDPLILLLLSLHSRQKTTGKGIETNNEKEEDVVNREVNRVEVLQDLCGHKSWVFNSHEMQVKERMRLWFRVNKRQEFFLDSRRE